MLHFPVSKFFAPLPPIFLYVVLFRKNLKHFLSLNDFPFTVENCLKINVRSLWDRFSVNYHEF